MNDQDHLPFAMLFAEPAASEHLPTSEFDLEAARGALSSRRFGSMSRDVVLMATTVSDRHADAVTLELMSRGCPVRRFNTDQFPESPIFFGENGGEASRAGIQLRLGDVDDHCVRSVWMRRPILRLLGPVLRDEEGRSSSVREEYDAIFGLLSRFEAARWVNSPKSLWRAESKIAQLRAAETLGFAIPRTLITSDPDRARQFYHELKGKVVVKAFRGQVGSPKTQFFMVYTSRLEAEHLTYFDRIRNAPVILQEELEKAAELRVTVIGNKLFAVEIKTEHLDWRSSSRFAAYRTVVLPPKLESACRRLFEHWNLAAGAIDLIRLPSGEYIFLELNSHADWLWIEQATGLPLASAMADLLSE